MIFALDLNRFAHKVAAGPASEMEESMGDEMPKSLEIALIVVGAIFALYLYLPLAFLARSRGYSFWLWLIAEIFVTPFICAVVLSILPHRARIHLRELFTRDLEAKRRRRSIALQTTGDKVVTEVSIGDALTDASP